MLGALNLYSRQGDAFDALSVSAAEIIAAHAGLAAQVAGTLFRHRDLAEGLQQAMRSRATIEQAKGDRARAVMIGDSLTDIATAKAAGVPVVAVPFGYSDRPIADLGANRLIGHFDELPEAVHALLAPVRARSVA